MINLTLSLPPTLNQTYGSAQGRFYKRKEVKEWETLAGWQVKSQCRSLQRLTTPIYVGITMFLKRDRDIDSCVKVILDLLQRTDIIENDNLIEHLNIKKLKDVKNPHLEIEIVKI